MKSDAAMAFTTKGNVQESNEEDHTDGSAVTRGPVTSPITRSLWLHLLSKSGIDPEMR